MKKFIPLILAAALCLPFAALAEDALSHQAFFCGDGMLRLTLEPYGAMLLTEPQD